jgi:YidC/Oxa1 family membrane protein insertase
MDRNQIIGIVVIFLIIIGYSIYTMPSAEEQAELKRKQDSALTVQKNQIIADSLMRIKQDSVNKSIKIVDVKTDTLKSDSTKNAEMIGKFGIFSKNAVGIEKLITLENNKIRVKISTLGGYPKYAELKEFKTHDSLPLVLFDNDENLFSINFYEQNKVISTEMMHFLPSVKDTILIADNSQKSITMRLSAGEGKYMDFVYSLSPDSYLLNFDIHVVGLQNDIAQNSGYFDVLWSAKSRRQEKGTDWENQNTSAYYKYFGDEVSNLSATGDEEEEKIPAKVKWIAYKDQFFSNIFIAKNSFASANVKFTKDEAQAKYLKNFSSEISIPYNKTADETLGFAYYYGPNQFKILKGVAIAGSEDLNLKKLVPLGWGIFGWVNRFAIIPMFNFLGSFMMDFGLIILLMTVIIKTVLFPLTYKSFLSSAKMRVLKPQIDEINAKIPKEKTMERQQETMKLYRKAGVNPMGGCIPLLLQFPILLAMYNFFPASIELRQKSFLWVSDLSTYDSIWTFPGGFSIPMYGDHISLFALLMAIAMLISTVMNGSQMATTNQQMPGMKLMMYLMPVMMVLWFNNYSAGLSYYYFLSNVITIGQTLLIRRMVDENKLLEQLNARKAKPQTKSRFREKMEQIQKVQQQQLKHKKK